MMFEILKTLLSGGNRGRGAYTYVASVMAAISIVAVFSGELPTSVVTDTLDAVRWDAAVQVARDVESWSASLPLRRSIGIAAAFGVGTAVVATFFNRHNTRASSTAWFAFLIALQCEQGKTALGFAGLVLGCLLGIGAWRAISARSLKIGSSWSYWINLGGTVSWILFGWLAVLIPVCAFLFGRIRPNGHLASTPSASETTANTSVHSGSHAGVVAAGTGPSDPRPHGFPV